ncbi:MAG: 3'-5' exonuclease [Eubacteriales bacterium]|nr:3'-5' exonuclease [Eubacteriales bacterium]
MKFTAIDFETANASMLSACSIGVVEFEDNIPIRETITLIRPPEGYDKFNWYNVRIHGITASMVKNAPTFDEVWQMIHHSIENQLVVCHNAAFDTVVLCRLLEYYHIPIPEFDYICTVKVSQKLWPEMENHKLDTVCNDLNIKLNHHEALSDARACGLIFAEALKDQHCTQLSELLEAVGMRIGHVSPQGRQSCSTAEEIRRKIISDKKKQESRRKYYARRHIPSAAGYSAQEKGVKPS